ncbi:MAG: 2-dehydro-3-deoxygalactonokinase [Ginsengibacter sp.]
MPKFISCDWGTSALRLRVVDINDKVVLAEMVGLPGISGTFELWKQSGKQEGERISFYQSVLTKEIIKLEEELNVSLEDVPLIISGMASSNMGMMELPYKKIPFGIDGYDLYIKTIEAAGDFKHRTLLISGAATGDDVMRGEETQLAGCLNDTNEEDQLFIFPGTHSKHVRVKDGKAVDFKTYMTGEFFDLLSKKSILSNVVEENSGLLNDANLKSFEKGVTDSLHANMLHSSFLVRTNYLLEKLSKEENYHYLSGLLIGTELEGLITITMPITIVSNELFIKSYSIALQKLGINEVKYQDVGKAVIKGHSKIYDLYKSKLNS